MLTREQTQKILFQQTSLLKIQDFLDDHPDVDPRSFLDSKKNTILHNLAYSDQKQLIKLYINHTSRLIQRGIEASKALYKKDTKAEIAAWVNQRNAEGFTALLYASFGGHVQLMHYLVEMGANWGICSYGKMNVLHMAAQNNRVATLIYFCQKVDYNQADQMGSTPLHWAAYSGSQEVVAYLLTLPNININVKDSQGQTPLLLATLYGCTKIVRRLLIKGANRLIKNKQGKLPIEIARQKDFKNITKMLDNDYTCFDFLKFYYNLKIDYRPTKRSYLIPIVFLVTTFCSLLIMHGLLIYRQTYFYAIEAFIIGMMILLYLSLLFPPKTPQKQNISLYINQTKKFCFQCSKRKPRRSLHCDICKVCIEQYDHHCTWINNCVGKRNIARFIIFIFFLILSLGIIGLTAAWGFLKETFIRDFTQEWVQFREKWDEGEEGYYRWIRVGLFCVNLGISLFVFPVLLLFLVQIKNLLINKTTYQRIRGQNSSVRDQLKRKKKRGPSLANCKAMCSNTRQSFSSDQSLEQRLVEEDQSQLQLKMDK